MAARKKTAKKVAARRPARIVKKTVTEDEAVERKVEKILKRGEPKTSQQLRAETDAEDQQLARTLQRLRRSGKIKVLKGRWVLTSVRICPKCKGRGWVAD